MATRETRFYILDEDGYLLCTTSARSMVVSAVQDTENAADPTPVPAQALSMRRTVLVSLTTKGGHSGEGIDIGDAAVEDDMGFPVGVGSLAWIKQSLLLNITDQVVVYAVNNSIEEHRTLESR